MADGKLRFGILGCANIARKNVLALKRSKECQLKAVASRSLDKAHAFIADNFLAHDGVAAYGSYEELLAASDIDAVYLPLPTTTHIEWVSKAAAAGKHILLEKPTATCLGDLQKMLAVCEQHGVMFMDGVMFMHHARTKKLMALLEGDPLFQPVVRVHSSFSFHGDASFVANNIRTSNSGDPLGTLGDLGWYCIRIGLVAFASSGLQPLACRAHCSRFTSDGVPLAVDATVAFDKTWERVLVFDCSFLTAFRQTYEIVVLGAGAVADKIITCDDFVIPRQPAHAQFQIEAIPSTGPVIADISTRVMSLRETVCAAECVQEAEMFESFARVVASHRQGNAAADAVWRKAALATQAVCDACMESLCADGKIVEVVQV